MTKANKRAASRRKRTPKATPTSTEPNTSGTQLPPPKTTPEKPGPGRPPGSKTERSPVVTEHPPSCAACGSTKRSHKKHGRTHYHAQDGWYIRTVWSYVRCLDCGNRYICLSKAKQLTPFAAK